MYAYTNSVNASLFAVSDQLISSFIDIRQERSTLLGLSVPHRGYFVAVSTDTLVVKFGFIVSETLITFRPCLHVSG